MDKVNECLRAHAAVRKGGGGGGDSESYIYIIMIGLSATSD